MRGMIAKYERAQIAERTRRGRLHRARSGSPAVLGRAPYGYRYVHRSEHADAHFAIDEVKAGTVREVFAVTRTRDRRSRRSRTGSLRESMPGR